ncbi:MAG: FAD binding domain-containing protein [Acidobacteriota bacterium]|jgi:xanthine dehydrogenase YagS FAD-binding subunit|nr:FAD binding domain-containing protein [Acidobacteriota bacterium]
MKTWKKFAHVDAKTAEEAAAILKSGRAALIAGGTDLLGTLRFEILPTHPETVVNLKADPFLDYIKEYGGALRIGALTRLEDIARSALVKERYAALGEAAHRTATPHIREMGTIGGNICQLPRCWYFRTPDNRFNCVRKGGGQCFAMSGDNRYHSIFGAVKSCLAVNPGDLAPALVALDAKIHTNRRTIEAERFWDVAFPGSTVLADDEIVMEVQVPAPPEGAKSAFLKFAVRKSIDFPVVNCAALVDKAGGTARICLNAVHGKPYRAARAEAAAADALKGNSTAEEAAEAAGAAAVAEARALPGDRNKWKIQIARTLAKRAVLACLR